jgi:type I restriction-modification system DNA methylase subunit
MATKATTKKTKSIEETLWDSANKLRGTVESSEYKHVVLSLIFLKFASDKFEFVYNILMSKLGLVTFIIIEKCLSC